METEYRRAHGAHIAWKGNAPIESISKMLGHSNLVQTQHYIGVTEEAMWLAADANAGIMSPPPVPRPDLADPIQPNTPALADPEPVEREPARAKTTDWIFSM